MVLPAVIAEGIAENVSGQDADEECGTCDKGRIEPKGVTGFIFCRHKITPPDSFLFPSGGPWGAHPSPAHLSFWHYTITSIIDMQAFFIEKR